MDFFLFIEIERRSLTAHDLLDQFQNCLARTVGVHPRQLFQIELRDQDAMDFRFVRLNIECFHF